MEEIYPRSAASPRPVGEGWSFFCVQCQASLRSLSPGVCPRCGRAIASQPPSVAADPSDHPRAAGGVAPGLLESPPQLVVAALLTLVIVLGLFQVLGIWGLPPTLLLLILLGLAFSDQSDLARSFDTLTDHRGFFAVVGADVSRTRDQTSIVLHMHCEIGVGGYGDLEVVVRLRGPDGHYLRTHRELYAGDLGELRLWQTLPQPTSGRGGTVDAVVRIPLVLLDLPASYTHQRLQAEVLFLSGTTLLAEQEAEALLLLPPRPGRELREGGGAAVRRSRDFRIPGPRTPRPGELEVMKVPRARFPDDGTCGICSDPLRDPICVCRRCETPMHRQCWCFTGGCATYGCGPRADSLDMDAPSSDSLAP